MGIGGGADGWRLLLRNWRVYFFRFLQVNKRVPRYAYNYRYRMCSYPLHVRTFTVCVFLDQ